MVPSTTPGLVDLLIKKMTYLNKAQAVHAENVANVNTPGYKPLEVKPFTFGDALKQAGVDVAVTNPRHIVPVSMTNADGVGVRATGKKVADAGDVELESMKVSETGMEHQMITSVFHKIFGLFKLALKGA